MSVYGITNFESVWGVGDKSPSSYTGHIQYTHYRLIVLPPESWTQLVPLPPLLKGSTLIILYTNMCRTDNVQRTLFKMISGATYSGVPQKVHVFRPAPMCFAKPKSTYSIGG